MRRKTSRRVGTRLNRSLQFEQCEVRRLMAVFTSLSSGQLNINGDNTSEDFAILGTLNPGEIMVMGRGGTSVDGVPNGITTISGVTGDLIVNLGDGDNILYADNVYLAGSLRINAGSGDDFIVLGAAGVVSTRLDCFLSTGNGDDVIRMEDYKVFIGQRMQVFLDGGNHASVSLVGASARTSIDVNNSGVSGANEVLLRGVTSGGHLTVDSDTPINSIAVRTTAASDQLNVRTPSGQNSIFVDTCYSGQFINIDSVSHHSGTNPPAPVSAPFNIDATVTIARCQADAIWVFTGGGDEPLVYLGGNDRVTLYGNTVTLQNPAHIVRLETGDGNDTVDMSFNVVLGNLFASLGDADDTATLNGNMITGFASLDGGNGTNRLNRSNNQFGGFAASRFS